MTEESLIENPPDPRSTSSPIEVNRPIKTCLLKKAPDKAEKEDKKPTASDRLGIELTSDKPIGKSKLLL